MLVGTRPLGNQQIPLLSLDGLIWTLPKNATHTQVDIPVGSFDHFLRVEGDIVGTSADVAADRMTVTAINYSPNGVRLTIAVGSAVANGNYGLDVVGRTTVETFPNIFTVVAAGGSATSNKTVTLNLQEDVQLKPEIFYLERVETINENSTSPKEYFTEVQGGTEISNVVSAIGGTYTISIFALCRNTSNGGACVVTPKINGSTIFAEPSRVEPDNGSNRFYVAASKRVTLLAGNNTISLELHNQGSGNARIYEANVSLTQII